MNNNAATPDRSASGVFSTDATGLDECRAPEIVDIEDGGALELRIAPVVKQLGTDRVRMLSYNGSIPGPTIRVPRRLGVLRSRHQRR